MGSSWCVGQSHWCNLFWGHLQLHLGILMGDATEEGCPIHPTIGRFVFGICDSTNWKSIREPYSIQLIWTLRVGWKCCRFESIRFESTRIVRIDWGLWPRFKNKESSCIVILWILTSGGLCRVGWKCCRFDSIRSNRHESFPLLSICHAGSRFARRGLRVNRVEM